MKRQCGTTWKRLPPDLAGVVRRYRRTVLFWRTILRLSQAMACAGGVAVAACAFDRLVDVPGVWRAPLPWLAFAVLCGLVARAAAGLLRRPDYDRIAHELDRASGDTRDHLRTLLDLCGTPASVSFLLQASCASASSWWRGRSPGKLVARRRTVRWTAACLAGIAAAAVAWQIPAVRAALLWQRFIDPLGNHMRPTATWFKVEAPPAGPLRAGDGLAIRARLVGRNVDGAMPLVTIAYSDSSSVTRRLELDAGGFWRADLKQLQRGFRWHLSMGPVRSRFYSVAVLPRPIVSRITVGYDYPKYSRLKPVTEVLPGRTIAALAGTKMKLRIESNVDLARAEGSIDDEKLRFRIARATPREAVLHYTISNSRRMIVELLSADNVESLHELPITFKAIADNPPSVSILNDLDGKSFFLTDTVEIGYRAQDDLGVGGLSVKAVPDDPRQARYPAVIDVDLAAFGAPIAEGKVRIPVADLHRSRSKFIRVSLVARDTKDQDASSPAVTLSIACDSFDRQLRDLLRSYTGRTNVSGEDRGSDALRAHERRLAAVKAARNRITILEDALNAGKPPSDDHRALVQQARELLDSLRTPVYYGSWWFGDFQNGSFPPRFRAMAEYANTWSHLAITSAALRNEFDSSVASADPKARLRAMLPSLGEAVVRQDKIAAQVAEDYRAIMRELTGYLASACEREMRSATEQDWLDGDFAANRRAAMKEIYGYVSTELKAEVPDGTTAPLAAAAASTSSRAQLEAAGPILRSLVPVLRAASEQATANRLPDATITPDTLLELPLGDNVLLFAMGMVLGGDNCDEDELFLLDAALRFLREEAGQAPSETSTRAPGGREAFALFQLLMRTRAALQCLRLGACTGELPAGSPELESQWLLVREARVGLAEVARRQPGRADELATLIAALSAFQAWQPSDELHDATFLESLRLREEDCERLAAPLMPDVQELLRGLDSEIATATPLLVSSLERYAGDVRREIEFFEQTHRQETGNLIALKLRLAALTVSCLKMLDLAELAAIYGAGGQADLGRLTATFAGLSRALQHFEEQVENVFLSHQHSAQAKEPDNLLWKGKAAGYTTLNEKLADLLEVAQTSGGPPEEAAERLWIKSIVQGEQRIVSEVLSMPGKLDDPKALLAKLPGSTADAPAIWEHICYLVYALRDQIADAGRRAALVDSLEAKVAMLNELPREVNDLPALLEQCRTADAAAAGELAEQLGGLLADMASSISLPRQPIPPANVREDVDANVDVSAVERAKQRNRERLAADRTMLRREIATQAFENGGRSAPALTWARGEVELNRRRAGLALNRTELGGLALAGTATPVNLPEHIYLELKRAREGAMPALFRDECYRYLNRILEKAKK